MYSFAYYKNTYNMDIQDMPDESKRKDWIKDERLWNDWKGIAKALEKMTLFYLLEIIV